jgi:hypothetical protein
MALSIQLGYPDVPKSITNPNVKRHDALDVDGPISFLGFIKITNTSFEPDTLQKYYNFYLKTWNNKNTNKNIDTQNLIIENYRTFIKEVALNYTTNEEKQFLKSIDFDDEFDMDAILGFYSKKLLELASLYNKKRTDVKFGVTRNKIRGTTIGINKEIIETTLTYLKNLEGGEILFDYDSIKSRLDVEISELYDGYAYYYDQIPDTAIYDNKDLDYGYDIFLKDNTTLISEIFSGLSDEMKDLKEVDDLLDNKRKLTEKYISTDFYYLSTGNTTSEFLSGKLFSSDNQSANFKNRKFPTSASTPRSNNLIDKRDIGFFKPCKQAIITLDGKTSGFKFNIENLKPNSLYYFPDPTIAGDNGNVITFIIDDSQLKKNYSSGIAANQPKSSDRDTQYFGYVTKTPPVPQKYLDHVFNSGFVQDLKYDIFGNTFGLFKDDHRYKKTIKFLPDTDIYNVVFNGYQFYDGLYNEYLAFNYQTSDNTTYTETTRSGLSSNTSGFFDFLPDVTASFGLFTPYNEFIEPTENTTTYRILEGAFISKDDFSLYPEVSSDLSAFATSTTPMYYDVLIEGGIAAINPLQRALNDPLYPTLSADFTKFVQTSAISIVDGGFFEDGADFNISITPNDYVYYPDVENTTTYTVSTTTYDSDYDLNGRIYVKNYSNKTIYKLTEMLPYLSGKYLPDVVNELDSNIIRFDIANDVIFLETPSYLVIDRILMNSGMFVDPRTAPISLSAGDYYKKLSNRFRINQTVYYCNTKTQTSNISSNSFRVYPEIYSFDLINFKNTKIFPLRDTDVTDFFNISGGDVRYTSVDSPILTHSSKNNIFNLSFLMKDQNDMPRLHQLDFYLNPNVIFESHTIHNFSPFSNSYNLSSTDALTLYLSGGNITYSGEELTL